MKGQYKYNMLMFKMGILLGLVSFFFKLLQYFPTTDFPLGAVAYISFIYLLSILVIRVLLRSLITERFNFIILDNGIEIIDVLSRNKEYIPYQFFKGFSTGILERRFGTLKQIVLYCSDGRIYSIVENNFYNFRAIRKAIKQHENLPFLGKEKIDWTLKRVLKDLVYKQYKFK